MLATTSADLAALAPRDFDAALFNLHYSLERARLAERGALDTIHNGIGDTRDADGWNLSDEDAEQQGRRMRRSSGVANLDIARQAQRSLARDIADYEAVFARRGGWQRFYVVRNASAHLLHVTTDCPACYRDTATPEIVWRTDLAGCTVAEVATRPHLSGSLCPTCTP